MVYRKESSSSTFGAQHSMHSGRSAAPSAARGLRIVSSIGAAVSAADCNELLRHDL